MKKATKINLTLLALVLSANGLYAQQGFGTNQPSKAAVIDLQSESKGLLIPRVTLTSLTVFLPVKGETATNVGKTNSLLVYNTATVGTSIKPGYYYWTTDGTTPNSFWKRLLANDDASALALVGDVTGTLGATVVGKIQGTPVANTTPTNNQVLTFNGSTWTPTTISPATINGKGTLTTQGGIEFTGGTNGTDKLLGNATIQVADLGITTSKLGDDAVTNAKLADNAVQTENIVNRNVSAEKLTAGTGTADRVAVADANGVVTYTNAVPSSSISGQDVSATSNKVTLAGTPAGAALKAFSIDVNESNLRLNNIGGTLDVNKITPGTNGQVLTTSVTGATVWTDKASLITSVSNISNINTLTTTVNGVTGTGVNIINSNLLSLNGTNQLVSTVNGVASTGLNLGPAVTAATTHTLGVSGNTLTSTVNGIAPTASILNNFSNTLNGTTLSTNANGLTAAINLSPAIKAGETQTTLAQNATTGIISYTPEGGSANATTANVRSAAVGNLITYNAGSFLDASTVKSNQQNTIVQGTGAISVPAATVSGNNTTYTVGVNTATTSALGVVSAGSGLSITPAGVLSVDATSAGIGKTLTGSGITVNGVTSLANTVLTDVTLGIADNAITSNKIDSNAVTAVKINTDVAGNGLSQATSGALQVNANNGLTVDATDDAVQLGGSLTKATTITTTATNTLALAGLQAGLVGDKIIVTDANGVLKTVEQSSIAIEPWNVQGGTTKSTANTDNIYQTGSVAIGKNTVATHTASGTSSRFDVNGAVRIGTSSGQIGVNSLGVGSGTRASGANSLAVGSFSTVSGANSLAVGTSSTVSGENSLSVGLGNTVSGFAAFSSGSGNSSKGIFSSTLGNSNETADVSYAAALGGTGNKANAMSSVTVGGSTNTAAGDNSFVTGLSNTSQNVSEAVLGRYNAVRTGGNGTTWGTTLAEQNSRTLFQIGNGTISGSTITGNNALTLTQSGRLGVGITGEDNNALPTETLDVGNGNVRVRDINTVTGLTTDKIVVAGTDGVLKTVDSNSLVSANQRTTTVIAGTNVSVSPTTPNATGNTAYTVNVPPATTNALGVVRPGTGLSINSGVLSVDATSAGIGKTLAGSGITVNGGTSLASTVLADVTLGIADNAITSAKIANNAVTSGKIADDAVTAVKINPDVAGNGLTQATDGALQVNAQNGISVNNDLVKLGGSLTENTTLTNSTFDLTLATTTAGTTGKLKVTGLDKTKVQATINTGTTTGITEHVLAVGADNVVKALKATMPKFFYMPSIIIPIASSQFTALSGAGESFTDGTRTGVLNLYERYKAQFGTTNTATQPSSPSAPPLPVLPASELHYYVTWYDTTIFQSVSLDATGKMTYVVRTGVDVTVGSFMNIVFAVREN